MMRSVSKRQKRTYKIIAIVVMIVLCVAAVALILKLAKRGTGSQESVDDAAVTADDSSLTDTEDADAGSRPPERVYSNKGTSSDAKFSIEAYDSAIEAGSGCIALPFVVSAEGTLYVTDDDYIYDMTGYGGYLSGMTDAQIEELTTTSGNSFLKLSDVFDRYGESVRYVVEVRYTGSRNIGALVDLIKKYGYENNVIVSSMYYDALRRVDSELDVPTLFLCQDQEGYITALDLPYIDIISVEKSMMTEVNCSETHSKDKKFGAWTLNEEDEIRSAIVMGADSYFTDETALAVSIEKEIEQTRQKE